jgi:hypothetical protein
MHRLRSFSLVIECTGTSVIPWTKDIRYKSLAAAGRNLPPGWSLSLLQHTYRVVEAVGMFLSSSFG